MKATPLGSTRDQVTNIVQRKGWKRLHDRGVGIVKETRVPSGRGGYIVTGTQVIGISSMIAELGWHVSGPVMTTYTYATWAFDANGKLIEISVDKEIDAP